jgi:hypothetical protein
MKPLSKPYKMILIEEREKTDFKSLTESEIALLVESRVEFLKNQLSGKLSTEHDMQAEHHDSGAIIDHFAEKADPTKNKMYTQYIVGHLYKNKLVRQEDAGRIHGILTGFEQNKRTIPEKQVNAKTYPRLSDLNDAVNSAKPQPKTDSAIEREKSKERKQLRANLDMPGHEKVYEGHGATIYKLTDKNISQQLYGGGIASKSDAHPHATEWCTADRREDYNMYHRYAKDGPLHVIHYNDDKGHRVAQLSVSNEQMMDEKDEHIEPHDFKHFANALQAAVHSGIIKD